MSKRLTHFNKKLNLIGAGQMGGAILKGWLKEELLPRFIAVSDPNPPANMRKLLEENNLEGNDFHKDAFVTILAIKPQIYKQVVAPLRQITSVNTLIISIMAGVTVKNIRDAFDLKQPIIRTIPNTPSSVGRGITAAFANEFVTATQKDMATLLLSALGPVEWVECEELIDVATAVSGSGPAYVFLMVESLAKAGIDAGLPLEIAMNLARATIEGAGELLYQSQSTAASTLRENVTSPNGTTHAALQVLMGENGLDKLMTETVRAATARSKELAS